MSAAAAGGSVQATAAGSSRQPFAIRHGRFRDALTASEWDELAWLVREDGRDEQLVRFAYDKLQDADIADDVPPSPEGRKDGDGALRMKRAGNERFQKSDYRNALNWYSLAVLHCPQRTKDWLVQLSIIYANRSACSYHLEDYDSAVLDVQQALDNGYPKDLQYKVYDRRARCFLATKQLKSALESFKATMRALDDSNLSLDKRRQRQLDVQIMLTMMAKDKNIKNASVPRAAPREPSTKRGWSEDDAMSGGRNGAHPAASDAVAIGYNETEGRHATASRNVPVGQVLLVERAHASVLLREYCHSHCTNCFVKLVAPLPCPDCTSVAFCGESCKSTALRSYHAIECPLLPTLYAAGVSVTCLIALRIITQRPLQFFVDRQPKLNNHTSNLCPKPPSCELDSYVNLYNLVTHRHARSAKDLLHRAHLAAFYLLCLEKRTDYFSGAPDGSHLMFIGRLLLHHLLLLQFNAFEVSELEERGRSEDQRSVFIGGSVYPTLALFNHSCDPCVVRYHKGTTVIVRNIRDLQVGEAITENYGPMFMFHSKEDRQQTLKSRYWFECNCIACSQDWPTWEQMKTNTSLRVRCTYCNNAITVTTNSMEFAAHCKVCLKKTNLLAALRVLQNTENKYTEAKQLMDKQEYEKALPKFMALLSLLHKHLVPPFRDYHLCQQAIRQCMLPLGNK